jgi:two-component sensor histidine kinase
MENVSHILKGKNIKPHESKFIDKNGEIRHAETYLTPLEEDNEIYAFNVISHDISERKKAEEGIKASLKEKELLLREIHHRVKNNLQIINSLLSLQTRYIKDDDTLNIFKESQNRVRSMAIIHEKLYNSSNLVKIDFEEYVKDLANNLFYTYKINPYNIKLNTDIDNILFDIETAIPCGLIINELVSNCLKHAFNGLNKGKINITLNQIGEEFTLSVSDNGIGLPEDFNFTNTDSLGLLLINNLVKQLDGTIELDKNGGTTFKIIFKELKYKERI